MEVFLTLIRTSLTPGVGTGTSVSERPGPGESLAMARIAENTGLFRKKERSLEGKEPGFGANAAGTGEPGHAAVGTDDSVTRHQQGPWVGPEGGGNGAGAAGRESERSGELAVTPRDAWNDRESGDVNAAFKVRHGRENIRRFGKRLKIAAEVPLNCLDQRSEPRRRKGLGEFGQIATGERKAEQPPLVPRDGAVAECSGETVALHMSLHRGRCAGPVETKADE